METLTLNDGTIITQVETVASIVIGLWVHIHSPITMSEAFELFSDPEKTKHMVSDKTDPAHPNGNTKYDGFTDLFMLKKDDGSFMVGLHKESEENENE